MIMKARTTQPAWRWRARLADRCIDARGRTGPWWCVLTVPDGVISTSGIGQMVKVLNKHGSGVELPVVSDGTVLPAEGISAIAQLRTDITADSTALREAWNQPTSKDDLRGMAAVMMDRILRSVDLGDCDSLRRATDNVKTVAAMLGVWKQP